MAARFAQARGGASGFLAVKSGAGRNQLGDRHTALGDRHFDAAGDLMDEAGRPTGPLWGRGRVTTTDQAQALENGVAERHASLCNGLEHAGLDQQRRALVASPVDMSWAWPQDDQLVLSFFLPAGHYATSVLNEILCTTEPDRHPESEHAAVE